MRDRPRHAGLLARGALLALACAALTGCYERTVHSEGFGYKNKVIEKPYSADGPVEDFLFGKQKPERVEDEPKPRKPGA